MAATIFRAMPSATPPAPRTLPRRAGFAALGLVLGLAGCATAPPPAASGDPLDRWIAAQVPVDIPSPPPMADAGPPADTPAAPGTPASPATPGGDEPPRPTDDEARRAELVVTAMNFLGVRYQRGGNSSEQGFDCSGFTRHVFETSLGLTLPRRSRDQAGAPDLLRIGRDALRPGDLVFFNTRRAAYSHVGIYIGDGRFVHAPRSGAAVRVEDMRLAYWTRRYDGARRASPAALQAAASPPTTPF